MPKQVASGSKSFWNMYSKQQQAVLAYVQQAVYSSNTQCSKPYAAIAASSTASSSSSTSSPTRTCSKHQHHTTTTTACSLGPAVAAHYYLYCRIWRKASSSRQLAAVAPLRVLLWLFVVAEYVRYNMYLVRARAQQYTESLLVYTLHAATLL